MLRLTTQDLNHVVLLELNLFVRRVLQEFFQRQLLAPTHIHRRLTYRRCKLEIRANSTLVVSDHVLFFDCVKLVDQFFQRALAAMNCLLESNLSSFSLTSLD